MEVRRFHMMMRRTTPVEPTEPVEPAEPLSHVIKGRHAPGANSENLYSVLMNDMMIKEIRPWPRTEPNSSARTAGQRL